MGGKRRSSWRMVASVSGAGRGPHDYNVPLTKNVRLRSSGRARAPLACSEAGSEGGEQRGPAWIAARADVARAVAHVAERDVEVGIGEEEAAAGAGVPEGRRAEPGHARRGELEAEAEAQVGTGGGVASIN